MITDPAASAASADGRLADLAEELARRLAIGDEAGADRLLAENPAHADELRALLPAARLMAGLGRPDDPPDEDGPVPAGLGRDLGDFRLLREIGRGGMGIVYEAQQLSLRRRVALKVLPTAAALDSRALQRFRNEAQAAAGLHHPNIVPVHGVGCERGVHYLATQLIDGPPLADLIRRAREEAGLAEPGHRGLSPPPGSTRPAPSDPLAATLVSGSPADAISPFPRPPLSHSTATDLTARGKARHRAAARLIKQAAEALEYAHSLGVVHRDVKPSNLLVDPRGVAWVADFGLAHLEGDTSLTMTGDLMGTLRYMSPEQATGRRDLVDHRSDVYSLGLTLYELLTLRPAFPHEHRVALTHAVIAEDPPRPRRLDSSIPRDLETVLLKATEKDPRKRFQTAKAFAEDLGRFIDGQPVRASRVGLADRSTKWVNRHRGFAASAAVILLVVTLASGLSTAAIGAAYSHEADLRKDAQNAARAEKSQRELAEADYKLALEAVERMLTQVANGPLAQDFAFRDAREGLLKDAEAFYSELIETHPNDAAVYARRAKVREMLRDYRGSISDGERAIELAPNELAYRVRLGEFQADWGDSPGAVPHWGKAVELSPGNAYNLGRLGAALWHSGRHEEGLGRLRQATRLDPALALPHKWLADIYWETGEVSLALREIDLAKRLDPDHPYVRETSAVILAGLGKHQEVLAELDEATIRRIGPSRAEAKNFYTTRAASLAALGCHAEAIAEYDRALGVFPELWHLFKRRAESLFQLGRYPEALADVARALEANPRDLSALRWISPTLVRACPDSAFREGMLGLATSAVERDPDSVDARAIRAELIAALRNPVEAPRPAEFPAR